MTSLCLQNSKSSSHLEGPYGEGSCALSPGMQGTLLALAEDVSAQVGVRMWLWQRKSVHVGPVRSMQLRTRGMGEWVSGWVSEWVLRGCGAWMCGVH